MLLGACTQEIGPGGGDDPIGANTLRITYEVTDHPASKQGTRVAATEEEKTVQSLYLLFFEPSSNGSGEFVDFLEIENPELNPAENDIDMTGSLLNVTSAYNILAIANIEIDGATQYIDGASVEAWMGQWAGKTESQVITEARAWTEANPGIDADELLMSGSGTKAANSFRVDLKLVRNQIRFDVVNRATDYDLVYVGLFNAYPMVKIWNDGTSDGMLDYSDGMTRIRNYYSFDNLTTLSGYTDNEVHGHFYVYENQVPMPEQNDNTTTALIIGLKKGGDATAYYRVNIAPDEGAQMLYRNHAYILTINSVLGDGHNRVDDAYSHPENDGLNYIINQWGSGDVGVSDQDNNSMLSSPYKTIDLDLFTGEIRGHRERGLSPNSIDITAVTSLPAGSYTPLDIIGEPVFHLNGSDDPYDGITVDLVDGELIFDPVRKAPEGGLESGDKITGSITLGFAGLRITINVVQTDLVTDFLNVYLPDGGIPRFAPFGGIKSGDIRVEASGDWSARIISETPGAFGFDGISDLSISRPINNKEFKVETKSNNTDNRKTREAFVVVTLDSDPLNYSRVVRLTQQQKAEIAITPSRSVTFDGTFDSTKFEGEQGSLALIPNNTIRTFDVMSGTTGEGSAERQNKWTFRIEVVDPTDGITKVVYWEPSDGNSGWGNGVSIEALNWFRIIPVHNDFPLDAPNNFTVDVTGKNTSGTTRTAKIVVYLEGGGNPDHVSTPKAAIDLIQLSSGLSFAPSSVPAVPKIGGISQAVGVQADASLQWRVAPGDFKTVSGTNTRSLTLVHHDAELLLENDTPVVFGTDYPITTKFKVKFPKIYYPNRDIPISATVKVTISDANGVATELSSTMTFTQATLTANTLNVWGMTGEQYDYGQLGNTYNRGWDGNSGNYGIKQIPGYKYVGVGPTYTDAPINSTINYLHATIHLRDANADNYTWKVIKDYIKGRDAWTILQAQATNGRRAFNNPNSPFTAAGYPPVNYSGDYNGMIDPTRDETKIYQFLVDKGHHTISHTLTNGGSYLYIDGVNTYLDKTLLPPSAVPLVSKHVDASNSSEISNNAVMVIDIVNKFIWMGESQLFWYDTWIDEERWKFLENIMYFVGNASKYGSHFTDMFLEEDDEELIIQTPEVDGGRYAQPAPWDSYWAPNGGVPSK